MTSATPPSGLQDATGATAPGVRVPSHRASALLGAFGHGAARLHVDLCRCLSAACRS